MQKTPKSLRLHIGLFGRTNVGKSSFLNYVSGQDVAITSPVAGTTTDVVENAMELLPIGPVVFLDTAGLDDISELAHLRLKKTKKFFDLCDVIVLIAETGVWTKYEDELLAEAAKRNIPVILALNKSDVKKPTDAFLEDIKKRVGQVLVLSCSQPKERDKAVHSFKKLLIEVCPDEFLNPSSLVSDLLPKGSLGVLIIPIDKEAPKGRIILPQVQTLRDALDSGSYCMVVKENEYLHALSDLKREPDLVVCDSQVVLKMVKETPPDVKCTTFSILFARFKGDLREFVIGAKAIDKLKSGDKVLIAEACSHHAIEDDIGRIKIPSWLKSYTGKDIDVEVVSGRDYPENLKSYKLVIHCGACMFTRRQMLARIQKAREEGVAITNYGVAIAFLNGVLDRVLTPFGELP